MAVDPTDTDLYPLGTDNLIVLQRNASDVDKVANSTDDTIENRFGESLGTLDYYNRQFQAAVDSIEVSTTEAEGFADDAEESALAASGYANYKGDWTNTTDVLQGESYSYGGTTWTAKQDSVGQTPAEGTYWLKGNGTAAQLDATESTTDFTTGRAVKVGDGGLFGTSGQDGVYVSDWDSFNASGFVHGQTVYQNSSTLNSPTGLDGVSILLKRASGRAFALTVSNTNRIYTRRFLVDAPQSDWDSTVMKSDASTSTNVNTGTSSSEFITPDALEGSNYWSARNTTVDGSGFIKEASPIVKLCDDTVEVESLSKFGGTPEMTKVSTGVYEITGTQGLRLDGGWYIETPNDRNGNKYFNIDWSQNIEPENTNGVVSELTEGVVVTIETFERVWNPETGLFENGDPVDICENQTRAVSLRFNEIVQAEEESEPEEAEEE